MPYIQTNVEVDFEIYCECGEPLCKQTTTKGNIIYIYPCKICKKQLCLCS